MEKLRVVPMQTTDDESQTHDDQHEEIVQANNQLKDVLQTFQDKIQQVVTVCPNLFDGVGEETGERFDHLLSTIENQTTHINALHDERDQIKEQLQSEIKQLQRLATEHFSLSLINNSVS